MRQYSFFSLIGIVFSLCFFCACHSAIAMGNYSYINDNIEFISESNNLWEVMRYDFKLPDFSDNAAVQKQIHWYCRHKSYFSEIVKRALPYIFYIYQQTKRRGFPIELALLPFIESEYNPFAFSQAGAAGLWQMMPGTATGFGLKIDWWYDGRRDVLASTTAALDYLAYLYNFLGHDWMLAIAAYNTGEGVVRQAVRYNERHQKATDFWSLDLPRETKSYLPKLLAISAIIQSPERYGIHLPVVPNVPYFRRLNVGKQFEFKRTSVLLGISVADLHALNPGFRRWAADPDGPFVLLVPRDNTDKVRHWEKYQKALLKLGKVHWIRYRVKLGDTLIKIARRYRTSVLRIRAINHLKSNRIKIDKTLLIQRPLSRDYIKNSTVTPAFVSEDHLPGPRALVHQVKKGESLEFIARKYGVTVGQILFWNQASYHHKPKPGSKFILWKKPTKLYYKVHQGDSLSVIADRYDTTVRQLRRNNHLTGDIIKVGQVIKLAIHKTYLSMSG